MNTLTARQELALKAITDSIEHNGWPPTLREIGAKMGISSTNGVNDHLRALERKGYICRPNVRKGEPGNARAIRVVSNPRGLPIVKPMPLVGYSEVLAAALRLPAEDMLTLAGDMLRAVRADDRRTA